VHIPLFYSNILFKHFSDSVSPAFLIRINASLDYASDSENIYEEIRDDTNNKGTAADSATLTADDDPGGGGFSSGGSGSGGGFSSGGSGSGGGGGSDGLKARVQAVYFQNRIE
jgi:uncharacterized membrane protein YgcG